MNQNKNTTYTMLGIAGAVFASIILATYSSRKRKKIPLSKTESFFKEIQSIPDDNNFLFTKQKTQFGVGYILQQQ